MKKTIVAFFISVILFSCSAQIENDTINEKMVDKKRTQEEIKDTLTQFITLHYDTVIAYDYDYKLADAINCPDKLAQAIKKKVVLSKDQVKFIVNLLDDTGSYNGSPAKCFSPHLGVVFYKENNVVAYVNICFECSHLYSSLPLPKSIRGSSVNFSKGFSFEGEQKFNSLCEQLKFSHCEKNKN